MSDKLFRSTENTQYYYLDGDNNPVDINWFHPADLPSFYRCERKSDKAQVIVHFHKIRPRDLRFNDNPS